MSCQLPFELEHSINIIQSDYGDEVSIDAKRKVLLKFGKHTAVGTDWETMAEMQGAETEETFATGNTINTIVSSSASDLEPILVEGHEIIDGLTYFLTEEVVLQGLTPVPLANNYFRVNRVKNNDGAALIGAVAVYEGGTVTLGVPDDATQVHGYIKAGSNQSQKAATTISSADYWIVTSATLSVLSKSNAYAEARLEFKPVDRNYWLPMSQNFACSDASGTINLLEVPYLVVPKNHDVRIAVKCSGINVLTAGGFNGYLAKITG